MLYEVITDEVDGHVGTVPELAPHQQSEHGAKVGVGGDTGDRPAKSYNFV